MRSLVKLCCKGIILAAVGLSSSAAMAQDFRFDRFFIVGDSLSDGGAYSNTAKVQLYGAGVPIGLIPDVTYKFTEAGPDGSSQNWTNFLAGKLSVTTGPDIINGVPVAALDPNLAPFVDDQQINGGNYAEGGSRVALTSISQSLPLGVTAIPVTTQVDRLLADVGGQFQKNDLVAVWAGANDVFANAQALGGGSITLPEALQNLSDANTELGNQIGRLQAAGAKNIIIMTIPVGTTVVSPTDQLFQYYNAELKASRNGKDGVVIDFARLVDATSLDPVRFGFVSIADGALTTTKCVGSSLACIEGLNTNPGGPFTRADSVHPSQQSHSNFADLIFGTLRAASQSATMSTSTLASLRQHSISLEDRLTPLAFDEVGKDGRRGKRRVGDLDTYASYEGGSFDNNSGQISPGSDLRTHVLKVGGDLMISQNALVGVSVSYNRGDLEYGDDSGGFDSRTVVGSLYTNIALTRSFYVNALVGAGSIDLDNITRSFNIGPSMETYTGDTSGDYRTARVGAGLMFSSGGWSINPAAAYTYEKVTIDGYTETLGAGSLSFGDNEVESSRVTASLTLTYKPTDPRGWSPMFRVALEHEFEDDDLQIHLGPDEGTIGRLYLPRGEGTYGYVTIGVSKEVGEASSLGISATTTVGQDGQTGVSGGVSFKTKF